MAHSLAHNSSLTCPDCGLAFDADIWLVVDADERPDLLERIRAGTLHIFTCPDCGSTGEVDAPLLLYRPNARPTLTFCPTAEILFDEEDDADEMEEEQAAELLAHLQDALGAAWRDEWLDEVSMVPIFMLPVTLSEDPDAAVEQMANRMMERLQQLQEEDPEAYAKVVETLAEFEEILVSEVAVALESPLMPALDEFMSYDSWEESYEFIKTHPELVSAEAEDVLGIIVESAYMRGDSETADFLEEHLLLLKRCREIGVREAFAEKMDVSPDDLE